LDHVIDIAEQFDMRTAAIAESADMVGDGLSPIIARLMSVNA
jgi:hypothetical protein